MAEPMLPPWRTPFGESLMEGYYRALAISESMVQERRDIHPPTPAYFPPSARHSISSRYDCGDIEDLDNDSSQGDADTAVLELSTTETFPLRALSREPQDASLEEQGQRGPRVPHLLASSSSSKELKPLKSRTWVEQPFMLRRVRVAVGFLWLVMTLLYVLYWIVLSQLFLEHTTVMTVDWVVIVILILTMASHLQPHREVIPGKIAKAFGYLVLIYGWSQTTMLWFVDAYGVNYTVHLPDSEQVLSGKQKVVPEGERWAMVCHVGGGGGVRGVAACDLMTAFWVLAVILTGLLLVEVMVSWKVHGRRVAERERREAA